MSAAVLNGLIVLMAFFSGLLAVAGVIAISRRLDRIERRRVYETECIVKSLQALEQQNLMMNDRLNNVVNVGQKLASELDRAARRRAQDEPMLPPVPGRTFH